MKDARDCGEAGVLHEALFKSKDREVEVLINNQRHAGHITTKNTKRRDDCLLRVLGDTIATELGRANQENQPHADNKELEQSQGGEPRHHLSKLFGDRELGETGGVGVGTVGAGPGCAWNGLDPRSGPP